MQIKEFKHPQQLAETLAADVAKLLASGGPLAVPGGETPLPFFAALKPKLGNRPVVITLTDERADGSNEHNLRTHLLTPHTKFVPLKLVDQLELPFAAIILGMGEDGHVASLFPHHAALDSTDRIVQIDHAPKPPAQRTSLTYHCMLQSRTICLAITGAKKRAVLDKALQSGDGQTSPVTAFLRQTKVPFIEYWAP